MGGIIAVTTRYSDGEEWRGSMWTNILPGGLFDVPFFDRERAESHVKAFIDGVVRNRQSDPEIEKLWGGHPWLAPVEYGIVVVDFQRLTVISHNGYCRPDRKIADIGHDDKPTPDEFIRVGARVETERVHDTQETSCRGLVVFRVQSFWTVDSALETTAETRKRIERLGFSLSQVEKRKWTRWLRERR